MIQGTIYDVLAQRLFRKSVISISGPSGTGKTTLALSLVGNFLTLKPSLNESGIWIQASEAFPKNRLKTMFANQPDILQYLNEHIFIIPSKKPCSTYVEQLSVLKHINAEEFIPPPGLKFIVIDNISHHLRYRISLFHDVKDTVGCLNDFFDNYLLPLILFCIREKVGLILIHEATFDIKRGKTRPFFYKLYDRIDALNINFRKELTQNTIEIKLDENFMAFQYRLVDSGIVLTKNL
ncbi:hypothetical protein ES705_34227 [subsurface metagenome]